MSGTRTGAETIRRPAAAAGRSTAEDGIRAHRAGTAWLIAPAGPVDERALAFAAGLAPDPECTVLVVDLPDGADDDTVDRVARAVPAGRDGLRVVFGRPPRRETAQVARRLADHLGRTVIAAAGTPQPIPGGGLFIPPERGPGWIRCAPGALGTHDSRTFPRLPWAAALPDRPWSLGGTVAEPLPAGVWLHAAQENPARTAHRSALRGRTAVSPESVTVVIGVPGEPALPVADIARFWQQLPPPLRPAVRFASYGPGRLSGGRHLADVLAQVLGEPVRMLSGLPRGAGGSAGSEGPEGSDAGSGEVLLVRDDGTPGRPLRAREFVHPPPSDTVGAPPVPYAAVHRWPLGDLPEIRPGTHRLADGVVVEVVPSGLWVRLAPDPAHAAEVRSADPDPERERVLCDAGSEEDLPRLRQLAQDLVRTFPSDLRRTVRVGVCRPAAPLGRPAPVVPAPGPGSPRPAAGPLTTAAAAPRPQPGAPGPPATSAGGHLGLLSLAAEILRRHPGLAGADPHPDAPAELAAVLRRLAGGGPDGTAAPGVPDELLRGGLRMLPVHQGATGLRTTLDEPMRQWYAGRPVVTDPNACEASTLGPGDEPGNTDFLIWSADGRRTDLLDPLCPDRVLFLPGSRFRVLDVDSAVPGVVMMRETGPHATPADERLDRAAVRELTRAWHAWHPDPHRNPDPASRAQVP
ncbi:hypothetical protein [Streptomyces ziwulingensis]|uniref:Uncharacterized protein n=1 Tax=Streptomyces ziwulingensis TaxID=1045501 RepID=A0ABP9CT78_9ACTN